jgi:hypothetical protein
MSRPELGLSPQAKEALINCNTQSGKLPLGTPLLVMDELMDTGMVRRDGVTLKGRAARGRLLHDALEEL